MSNILTGFNMQGNDPIDDRIVSKSNLETLEQYLKRVPVQKRYYGLTFFALDKNNELRKYTFQTSLINPTIDDNEEEIERIDKELQEHVSDKAIHKTSEEIRSEIVDADIPDTISRVQWTLDQINTAVINLIGGASDEYNTLKRIQTKIEELRAKIYGDDGGTVLKTLEQALKFLNQYKDFIVDIPENFVSKQDIVDNLTTDDPTKVLSAKQGKVLSDTLTNYFESAMQSIRTETDRAINAENRIETKLDKEIDRSIKEDQRIDAKLDAEIKRSTDEDLRIDSKLDSEINRSTTEDDRLDKKIDAETTRATDAESNLNTKIETETDRAEREESRIETKLDNEIARSTNKDTEHDNRLTALEGDTHEQNTDLGTTNSTFQLKYNTGNKIKHESDAISVRNAADTDYVNFIAKNATFKGDLLVEGQSFVTEAETVEIKDNLLLLNKGEVGAGVTKGIAGLEIDRGTEPNYFIIFDESDNRFKAGVEGDLWNLALRESDDNMLDGYFISWNSKDKILSTTNIVKESTPLLFGRTNYKQYSGNRTDPDGNYSSYAFISEAEGNHLYNFSGSSNWNIDTDKINFRFWKPLLGTTFKRASDNSEVLYHADIVNNLTSGGTNKVLSAEQGKLLQNSITSIQGSYLPLSGGTMTGSISVPYGWDIRTNDGNGILKILSNKSLEVGHLSGVTKIRSNSNDILHVRNDTSYKIYDAYNLPDPVTLSGNNTFTGNNIFQAGKFNVGPFQVTSSGSLLINISASAGSGWARNLIFRANSDSASSSIFGGYNTGDNTSAGFAYIGIGDVVPSTAQYKFYSNQFSVSSTMVVPESSFRIFTGSSTLFYHNKSEKKVKFGNSDSSVSLELLAQNLYHTKYDSASSTWKNYTIYSEYNLPNPVRYALDDNNYPTLLDSNGSNFSYIKAGPSGILPNTSVSLSSGGTGYCGTLGWSFKDGYFANVHTYKILIGPNNAFIDGQSGNSSHRGIGFYTSQNAACPVYVGSLCVSDSYNNGAPYIPTNGIYSKGNIRTSGWLTFEDNEWTDTGWTYKDAKGSIKVLSVINETNNKPTSYGSVLQFNSRQGHWCTQIWCDQTNAAGVIGTLRFRTTKSYTSTEWNPWTALVTTSDLGNYLPLTGGTLSGNLTINTVGSTTFVINNNDTNGSETFMRVLRKGTASAAIGFRDSLGAYIYNYNSNKYLFIDNDGYARVGTTSGSTRLALITDIPTVSGYLPLTGGTLTGTLSINSGGSESLIINNSASAGEAYVVTKTQGTTRGVMGWNSSLGMFLQDNRGYTFSVKADGVYFGASSSTLTKLPTSTDLSNYLPLTGGNLTGKLSIKSSGSNLLILDSSSSTESVIHFLRSSTTKGAVGYYDNIGAFIYNFPSNTYLFVKDDGKPYVGTKTNYKKILTETDITGYATQSWVAEKFPNKTGAGASGTWGISISGNATTASTASKLGSTTIGGSAKPIYLSSGTPTACSATVGSTTVPVYMNAGTITQCSTTLGVSITGNAATATNSTQLGGTAASSYVKANDNISRLTNDSGYTTQEWVNGQGFLTSDSILDKFVPTTGGYIRNSDQILLRLQRTGVSTGTSRTIEMYFDDCNTDGTNTIPRGSIGYNSEVGMFLYSAKSKKFLAMEYTGRPFYGTPENRYYLLGSNTQYHNLDGYQRIGDIMIQWGYFSVQGNSTRAVNFPVSFTNTVWSVTGSWDNTTTGSQENWGFTDYTSSGFTIINGDGSSRVFHYIAIGPFTRS